MRSLQDELREYIAAAFPGIWITSFEHDDALREIVALCAQEKWSLATWDVDKGLHVGPPPSAPPPIPWLLRLSNAAIAAFELIHPGRQRRQNRLG